MLPLRAWAIHGKTHCILASVVFLVVWLAPHQWARRGHVSVLDIKAARKTSIPICESLNGRRRSSSLGACHRSERVRPPHHVGRCKEAMWAMEACGFMSCHACERGAPLASSAASAATSLSASVVTPSSAVGLGAPSLLLVRPPTIPLVLHADLLEGLLHGECHLLDGMSLCDWRSTCNRQSRYLLLQRRLILNDLIECWGDALGDRSHETRMHGAIHHTWSGANRAHCLCAYPPVGGTFNDPSVVLSLSCP
jgi:hypothetical protein